MNPDISDTAIDQLKQAIGGTVWRHGDAGFVRHSQLFNTTIRSSAKLLVRPLDARDVSETIKFCARHNLSPSVKSGGYGTHGWAVEGDVIIDMRLIAQVTIERPLEDVEGPDWISMKETPHKAAKDPDMLKGKNRVSSTGFPNTDSAAVGPPPIHGPFTQPQRRSADEAFDKVVVVPPEGAMDVEGAGRDLDSDRPMRRLRVTSTASGHTSGSSELTPSTAASPHTPADGTDPPKPEPFAKRPFSFDDPPPVVSGKSLGPLTPNEISHDEGMLPPSSERPAVGFDIRGFVGRNPGGWDVTWDGGLGRAPTEPMGAAIPSPPAPAFRSTAPSSARPFDFADSTPVAEVNALANPHGNPGGTALFPGLGGARMPFQFMTPEGGGTPDNSARSSSNTSTPGLVSTPNASSTSSHGVRMTTSPQPYAAEPSASAPTVTHLAFEPTAPVSHTYVTFGAGASQKDINGFCAAHPLGALVPGGGEDESSADPEFTPKKKPTLVADSAQPDLYKPPQSTGFGSFFPGAGAGAGSLFGQSNSIFGRPPSAPAIPYYVPFAAHPVGSSVMLLGGFGFMSRLRGLSMDCLVEAEVVLADGRIVWVSEGGVRGEDGNEVEVGEGDEVDVLGEEFLEGERARAKKAKGKEKDDGTGDGEDKPEPDTDDNADPEDPPKKRGLWWALRGAGSAFGLVIRYKAKAFPVPVVFAGNLIYNFNKLTAGSLIKHFRDCIKAAPRELYANCILTAGPKNKGALVVIQICYAGTRADGLPFLQAISSWEGEGCLLNEVQEKEFVWQQDSIAKVLKGGSGRKWFIRSDIISSLTDEIIHRTVKNFSDTPDGCTWLFELAGGALADTTDSCLPKAAREAAFTIVALHQWKLEFNDPACVLTAEEWIRNTLGPVSTGGPFPCFLERRETRARILGTYGAQNWARLCALKRKYDPNGMFKHNFWPLDEHGKAIVDPREMRSGANRTSGHAMDLTLDDNGVPI